MDHNELSVEAHKAYGKLKEQSATSKQMIADQTRQKNCNVMTKYLTDVGLSYVDVSELPMIIDGITFDVIPEQRDFLGRKEIAFGDYQSERWGWQLANPVRLPEPIPCRGMLGLWEVPPEIVIKLADLSLVTNARKTTSVSACPISF